MPLLSQVASVAGVSRDTINKWMERGVLRKPIPTTPNGVARQFSRVNALEIAFTAALTLHGEDPHDAAIEAGFWLIEEKEGSLARYWTRNPRRNGQANLGRPHDREIGFTQLAAWLAEMPEDDPEGEYVPARSLYTIDRGAIVAAVDSL